MPPPSSERWKDAGKIAVGVLTLAGIVGFFAYGFWSSWRGGRGNQPEKAEWSAKDIYVFEYWQLQGKTYYLLRNQDAIVLKKPVGAAIPKVRQVALTDDILAEVKKAVLVTAAQVDPRRVTMQP